MNASQVWSSLAVSIALATTFVGCSVGTPVSPDTTSEGGASRVEDGARFVQARKCAHCHQSDVVDDGVLSGQTVPQPGTHAYGRNLTPDEATGLGGWSDEALLRAIRAGVDDQGAHLCPPMPHFTSMGDGEGDAIVAYLRSLPPVTRTIPASECGTDFGPDDGGATVDARGEPGVGIADAGPDAPPGDSGVLVIIDADVVGDAGGCAMLAPSVPAACTGCTTSRCQPNGCYGGSWCQPSTGQCHRKPANCL
jgi:hypothetical protein